MSNNTEAFCIETPAEMSQEQRDQLNKTMDRIHKEMLKEVNSLAQEKSISLDTASDILYLRSRSRWSQEKEDYLIALDKAGLKTPNIMDDFEVKPIL